MMTTKEVFTLGSKWIGVFCLAGAVGGLFQIFPLAFVHDDFGRSRLIFQWSGWLSLIGPVTFLATAVYLLLGSSHVEQYVLREDKEKLCDNFSEFFNIALKVYGLYLIATYIPTTLWLTAIVLVVLRAPGYLSVEDELQAIRDYLPTVAATLILGICCTVWSAGLARLALRKKWRT